MNDFLKEDLKPFEKYLKTKGLLEICINKPGEIWLETVNGWQVKTDPKLTFTNLRDLARSLAAYSDQVFNETTPLLSTTLPAPYNNRIQIAGPPLTRNIAIVIRAGKVKHYPLTTYTDKQTALKLQAAVQAGETILIAGGTQSGKTTLLNSLIRFIPKAKRLLIIEDTKEISADHLPNRQRLILSKTGTSTAKIDHKDVLNACMRLRPDILILGEIDIYNTVPFLRLLNTGHNGSVSTIHANGISEAVDALVLNSQMTGLTNETAVREYVKKALDWIVFIHKQKKTAFELEIRKIEDKNFN